MDLPLVGGMYMGRSHLVDCQECINLFSETEERTSKAYQQQVTDYASAKMALLSTPGLKLFVDFSLTGIVQNRGLYVTSTGRMFTIVIDSLYEISPSGTYTVIGGIRSAYGQCGMADNGQQLIIVDGITGYIFDLITGKFEQITSPGFPVGLDGSGPTHVIYLDGRFIVNRPQTDQFFFSETLYGLDNAGNQTQLLGGLSWDGASFTSADSSPDPILALVKVTSYIWIFGSQSMEVWWDVGALDVPYERINSANNDVGTSAPFSVATNGSSIFWLGSNQQGINTVWMAANGSFTPQRISTHAIDFIISGLSRQDDAVGYSYQQEGHIFYILNFVTGQRTLVYDATTNLWHERSRWVTLEGVNGQHQAHRAINHCVWNGKNYVGDRLNGNVYELSLDVYQDETTSGVYEIVRRDRTTPHIHSGRKRLFFRELEFDLERGVSNSDCKGLTGVIMLSWSNDGGMTWSNVYTHPIGKQGEFRERVHFHRLGYSRDRVFRLSIADPYKVAVIGGVVDVAQET
jgi:hypothetical protein